MGAYDSRSFSKQFSLRTMQNYKYIDSVTKREEKALKFQQNFLEEYDKTFSDIDKLITDIRNEANNIVRVQKGGKNELKSKMHKIAGMLDGGKKRLNANLKSIVNSEFMQRGDLYEVTQLLNSMMGIVVLPYEMHKEFFNSLESVDLRKEPKDDKDQKAKEDLKSIENSQEYKDLKKHISDLKISKSWINTYTVNNKHLVFDFLRHIRNAVSHSGDSGISIIPLDEGKVITGVLFYDTDEAYIINSDTFHEFAMYLKIDELAVLIEEIAQFYQGIPKEELDKTQTIKSTEKRIASLGIVFPGSDKIDATT